MKINEEKLKKYAISQLHFSVMMELANKARNVSNEEVLAIMASIMLEKLAQDQVIQALCKITLQGPENPMLN